MSDTPKSSSVDDDDDDVGSRHDSDAGTAGVEGGTVLTEVEHAEDGEPTEDGAYSILCLGVCLQFFLILLSFS
jgi:hypothetical protein